MLKIFGQQPEYYPTVSKALRKRGAFFVAVNGGRIYNEVLTEVFMKRAAKSTPVVHTAGKHDILADGDVIDATYIISKDADNKLTAGADGGVKAVTLKGDPGPRGISVKSITLTEVEPE